MPELVLEGKPASHQVSSVVRPLSGQLAPVAESELAKSEFISHLLYCGAHVLNNGCERRLENSCCAKCI
jgi:hypothetical protein